MIELAETTRIPKEPAHGASVLTRRIYDAMAPVYAVPSLLFHSKAHGVALTASEIRDGSRTLEVAIGSGEMFERLIDANPSGQTVGVDLSPKMAARSQKRARQLFPRVLIDCQAADVRSLPFPDGYFDAIVCCYLFELIPRADVPDSLVELRRVLKGGGRFTTILVGQNKRSFNWMYRTAGSIAPAFWGRQMEEMWNGMLGEHGFEIESDTHVQQLFYSSRVVTATHAAARAAAC